MISRTLTGNVLTRVMHSAVARELNRFSFSHPVSWFAEKSVLLNKRGKLRAGKFDFFLKLPDKNVGFEVLARPTRAKLVEKLAYAREADEFVFVLPQNVLTPYSRVSAGPAAIKLKPRFLGKEFSAANLFVWLFDFQSKSITTKSLFSELFNV